MRRWILGVVILGMLPLALVATAPVAAAEAFYYETTIITDAPDDFSTAAHNGALDIVGVHVSERYSLSGGGYASGGAGSEVIWFRVEVRDRGQFETYTGNVPVEYTLGFKVGGQEVVTTVRMTQTCSPNPTQGIVCTPPAVEAPHFTTDTLGIVFVFPREATGMLPGVAITDVYAASATVQGETPAYQDVAPSDNANRPAGGSLDASEFGGPYTLVGSFPFFTLERTSPLLRPVVAGGTAEWNYRLTMHPQHNGLDRIILQLAGPPGFTFENNVGNDFVVSQPGEVVDMTITGKAPATAQPGEPTTVGLDVAILQLGGHQTDSFATQVTGPKATVPEITFNLDTPGPFTAGDLSTLKATVLRNEAPMARFGVSYDFIQAGAVVATVRATESADGVYDANYVFPSSGEWTVDVYVSELAPAPHQEFSVTVKGAEGAPGPGLGVLVALAAAVVFTRRQR